MRLQDFINQEQIGEERAQMNRRVQVVDHLRADGGLREDELNRGLRVLGVVLDDADEREVRRDRLDAESSDESGEELAEIRQRALAAFQVFTRLAAGIVVLIGGKTLGGVREQELVRLLDDVDARVELGENFRRAHACPAGLAADEEPRSTGHRLGSWCSRY